ncbi:MAG: nucleotidyltransferase domain-containing protein [Bacteroidales bacterium]|nr:nucleotidyltransferase domain-containing protein [Bacteroidales bacterium]MCF8339013.1 nucleotidyltransferase domain-containing protein [Bacteroidales bacterium]
MEKEKDILKLIRKTIRKTDPEAKIILYGSRARGDNKQDSDIDLLILLDKEKITRADEKRIKYPLYDIEFETGKIISPLVMSKRKWEKIHRVTPFYENVQMEGIPL